jgi:hypothetical protein
MRLIFSSINDINGAIQFVKKTTQPLFLFVKLIAITPGGQIP